eukprot:m.151979 g.151979  ORF g.151979 m.151979 type:complete len:153 (-) comp9772_c0_seq3:75-533(-)
MGGILLAEVALAAIIAIKQAIGPAILMVPLIIITLYAWHYTNNRFQKHCLHLPIEIREDDPVAEQAPIAYVPADEFEASKRSKYVQPELLAPATLQPEVTDKDLADIQADPLLGLGDRRRSSRVAWDGEDVVERGQSRESEVSAGKGPLLVV